MNITKYTESGMNLELPQSNHFQFETCKAYLAINSKGVTEMDFVVLSKKENTTTLWLIELKQFYNDANQFFNKTDPETGDAISKYIEIFSTKTYGTLFLCLPKTALTHRTVLQE